MYFLKGIIIRYMYSQWSASSKKSARNNIKTGSGCDVRTYVTMVFKTAAFYTE